MKSVDNQARRVDNENFSTPHIPTFFQVSIFSVLIAHREGSADTGGYLSRLLQHVSPKISTIRNKFHKSKVFMKSRPTRASPPLHKNFISPTSSVSAELYPKHIVYLQCKTAGKGLNCRTFISVLDISTLPTIYFDCINIHI
jgi:hypothetical protein